MSTIALIHEGSVSIEHLASMSNTAMAVEMMVTAKRSARIENAKRDKGPHDDYDRGNWRSQPVQHVDPAGYVTKRWITETWEETWCNPPIVHSTDVEFTWHSQFVRVYSGGQYGSKNEWKSQRAHRRALRIQERRQRKAARPHRPTRHELSLVALRADFDGRFPFQVTVPQTAPQAVDMFIASKMRGKKPVVLDTIGVLAHSLSGKAARRRVDRHDEAAAKRPAHLMPTPSAATQRREAAKAERNRAYWAKVYQRPEAEQAAKRCLSTNAVLSTATK